MRWRGNYGKKDERSFIWILRTLDKHRIPFQIQGGFVARAYESMRKLEDMDIAVPDVCVYQIYCPMLKGI